MIDICRCLDPTLVERILSPIPLFTRNPILIRQELANILTGDIERRIIVDFPIRIVLVLEKQVGMLPVSRQVFKRNTCHRKTRNVLNLLFVQMTAGYVDMCVYNGVFRFAFTRISGAVLPSQDVICMVCQLQNIADIIKDIEKFLLAPGIQFCNRHNVFQRDNEQIARNELTKSGVNKEIIVFVDRLWILPCRVSQILAISTICHARSSIQSGAVGDMIANVTAESISDFLKLLDNVLTHINARMCIRGKGLLRATANQGNLNRVKLSCQVRGNVCTDKAFVLGVGVQNVGRGNFLIDIRNIGAFELHLLKSPGN